MTRDWTHRGASRDRLDNLLSNLLFHAIVLGAGCGLGLVAGIFFLVIIG